MVEFSYASDRDAGLYDAVNKGFRHCGLCDFMSWINSDDLYQPSAFVSITKASASCGRAVERKPSVPHVGVRRAGPLVQKQTRQARSTIHGSAELSSGNRRKPRRRNRQEAAKSRRHRKRPHPKNSVPRTSRAVSSKNTFLLKAGTWASGHNEYQRTRVS